MNHQQTTLWAADGDDKWKWAAGKHSGASTHRHHVVAGILPASRLASCRPDQPPKLQTVWPRKPAIRQVRCPALTSSRVPTTGDMQGTMLLVSYGRRNDLNLFSVVCGKEAGMKLRLFCCTASTNQGLGSSFRPECFNSQDSCVCLCLPCNAEFQRYTLQELAGLPKGLSHQKQSSTLRSLRDRRDAHIRQWVSERGPA